jgi:hypothetical protein
MGCAYSARGSNRGAANNKPRPTTPSDSSQPGGPDKTTAPSNPGPASSANVPNKKDATVNITRLEEDGYKLTIQAAVQGMTDGDCVAEFTTPHDKPVVRQVKITSGDASAMCGPIVIPVPEFAYLGDWQAVVTVYAGGQKAVSPAKTITIQ